MYSVLLVLSVYRNFRAVCQKGAQRRSKLAKLWWRTLEHRCNPPARSAPPLARPGELADELDLQFQETSAKDGTNVERAFQIIAEAIWKNMKCACKGVSGT